jgi:hypothetical protein
MPPVTSVFFAFTLRRFSAFPYTLSLVFYTFFFAPSFLPLSAFNFELLMAFQLS